MIEDVIPAFSKVKHFTIIDMKRGYWQIILSEGSLYLTAFNTPYVMFRFKRIPIRLNKVGDAFKQKLDRTFYGPSHTTDIADMTIYGTTSEEHNKSLTKYID